LIDQTPKKWLVGSSFVIFLAVLFQRFGEIVYITRLDRIMDPVRLAARAWNLWNPYTDMGAVQYQTSGYWISFDSFFAFGNIAQVPVWLTERFYIAILLIVALWGLVRLADALDIGRPVFRLLAGLGYTLSPMVISRVGSTSVFVMGLVLLPWILIPLVSGSQTGSTRRSAMRSGFAIALIGGASAAAVFAVLTVPALYLLTRTRGPRRASLTRWWILAVLLAIFWWSVGLYFSARFGADPFKYTETSQATTSTTSIFEVLRGTADWLSRNRWYDVSLPAGWTTAFRSIPIIGTTLLAAIGLAGLSRKNLPERKFLILTLFVGVVLVGGGFGGLLGNPLADTYQSVLNDSLKAFRNVYKFQPLIALPLALGLTHALTRLSDLRLFQKSSIQLLVIPTAAIVLIAAGALPLLQNQLFKSGFSEIPDAWEQARTYVSKNIHGRVLIEPSAPEADYNWGFTQQNPLEWGTDTPSAVRSQAPLGGANNIEYLDAVEIAIGNGGNVNLVNYLRRGGYSAILVSNDTLYEKYSSYSPKFVHQALTTSGLKKEVGFGSRSRRSEGLQQIEIYSIPKSSQVQTYAAAEAAWLSGDIESTLNIPENNFGDRAYILTSDEVPKESSPDNWIITDGNQRYGIEFGLYKNNRSYILGPNESFLNGSLLSDKQLTPENKMAGQTAQILTGVKKISASKTGFLLFAAPGTQPANIYDDERETSWVPTQYPIEKDDRWVKTVFKKPRLISPMTVELLIDKRQRLKPITVIVETDQGEKTNLLKPTNSPQTIRAVHGKTRRLKVTITKENFRGNDAITGIRELNIAGTPIVRRLKVPHELNKEFSKKNANNPAWVFTRSKGLAFDFFNYSPENEIRRTFEVPKKAALQVFATGSVDQSPDLLRLYGTTPNIKITANDTFGNSIRFAPINLIDRSPKNLWVYGVKRPGTLPTIKLAWTGEREIAGFRLGLNPDFTPLKEVIVKSEDQKLRAKVSTDGSVVFPTLIGDELEIALVPKAQSSQQLSSVIGLTGIDIPAIADLYPESVDLNKTIIVNCDSGPTLFIDNNQIKFSAITTLDKFANQSPVALSPCDESSITLSQGINKIDTDSGKNLIAFDQIVLGSPPLLPAETTPGRWISIKKWGDVDRSVTIGAGKENILVVNEIFNKGWAATYRGHELNPIQIDGWRQGFYVPSGPAGKVALSFTPNSAYQIGIIIGLILLIGLFVLAIWPDRKKRNYAPIGKGHWPSAVTITISIAVAIWCTGIGVIALPLLWWIKTKDSRALPAIAFTSFIIAGAIVLFTKGTEGISDAWRGAYSYPTSVFAALAFLSVVAAFLPTKISAKRATA